jgi:hypothetical protein
MKPSRTIRQTNHADRSVARWTTVLLIALGAIFMALFLSARLLLSLATDPGSQQTSLEGTSPLELLLPVRDDRTVRNRDGSLL